MLILQLDMYMQLVFLSIPIQGQITIENFCFDGVNCKLGLLSESILFGIYVWSFTGTKRMGNGNLHFKQAVRPRKQV